MVVEPFQPGKDDAVWDAFVRDAPTSTMLHTRRFLSYHGERFRDCSLVIRDDKGRIVALFPAAQCNGDESTIVSHPGATFGGLLCSERCRGEGVVRALQEVAGFYLRHGHSRLLYKAVPYIYHVRPFQDDLYAIFRLGGRRVRCDLSACIDLGNRGKVASRRKRGYKKAEKCNVHISEEGDHVAELWEVLKDNLQRKHGLSPVHSLEEIRLLQARFPDDIHFVTAHVERSVVAGVVIFDARMVSHAQYIAASVEGYQFSALDKVFEYCIDRAKERGKRYFDFGNSNEQEGLVLNAGLHQFKTEFGAGAVVHEFYELTLERAHGLGGL